MIEAERTSTYLFGPNSEAEGERLAGIQQAWDPGTFHHLTGLGVSEGWRCLEVGAGAGSVARWLCERVGEKGSVLATDIDTTLLEGIDLPNLEVRRHDIVNDALPEGEFDLVHTRLVLIHLPERERVLRRLARALAPGGWLLVEDISFLGAATATARGALAVKALLSPLKAMMRAHGADLDFARRLPVLINRLGLTDVGAEGRVTILIGGTDNVGWAIPTIERLQERLTAGAGADASPARAVFERVPALRRAVDRQLDRLGRLFDDPEFAFHCPSLVAAWGRRPA